MGIFSCHSGRALAHPLYAPRPRSEAFQPFSGTAFFGLWPFLPGRFMERAHQTFAHASQAEESLSARITLYFSFQRAKPLFPIGFRRPRAFPGNKRPGAACFSLSNPPRLLFLFSLLCYNGKGNSKKVQVKKDECFGSVFKVCFLRYRLG